MNIPAGKIIIGLVVVAVIGLGVGLYQANQGSAPSSSEEPEPKYTQQQIADMQAELEEIEAALIKNEEEQADTRRKIDAYYTQASIWAQYVFSGQRNPACPAIDPQSALDTSYQLAFEQETKLNQLQAQHRELLERKLLLKMKLEAIQ